MLKCSRIFVGYSASHNQPNQGTPGPQKTPVICFKKYFALEKLVAFNKKCHVTSCSKHLNRKKNIKTYILIYYLIFILNPNVWDSNKWCIAKGFGNSKSVVGNDNDTNLISFFRSLVLSAVHSLSVYHEHPFILLFTKSETSHSSNQSSRLSKLYSGYAVWTIVF